MRWVLLMMLLSPGRETVSAFPTPFERHEDCLTAMLAAKEAEERAKREHPEVRSTLVCMSVGSSK